MAYFGIVRVLLLISVMNSCTGAVAYDPLPALPGVRPSLKQSGTQVASECETRCRNLEAKVNTLEQNLSLLATTTTLSIEFRESLLTQLDVLTDMLIKQKTWLVDVKKATKDMRNADQETKTSSGKLPESKGHIAFTAFLDNDMVKPGTDQTIVFNRVILNEGNAYNEHSGVFTCPQSGVYDFFFSIGQRDKNGIWAKLLVNSDLVVAAAVDSEHKYQDLQGSNRAIVRLDEGDVVRVVINSGATHLEGDIQRFTTFSGIWVLP